MAYTLSIVAALVLVVFCQNALADRLTGRYGCLASPNFPSNYQNNEVKSYQIVTSPGHLIKLTFHAFDLESHSSCQYDYLEVVEKSGYSRKFCGARNPGQYVSQGNELTINFKSDQSQVRSGFFATFVEYNGPTIIPTSSTQGPYPTPIAVNGGWCSFNWTSCSASCGMGTQQGFRSCACPPPSNGGLPCVGASQALRNCSYGGCPSPSPTPNGNCNKNMTALSDSFTSPGHPANYHNNANCYYNIMVPGGKRIVLHLHTFELESGYDFLEIRELRRGSLVQIQRLSGSRNATQYTSAENVFSLRFTSDHSVTRNGFAASYSTIDAGPPSVDGGWCSWAPRTPCTVSCGYGHQQFARTCQCPSPSNGGSNCTGSALTTRSCYQGNCPATSMPMPSPTPMPSPVPRCQAQSFTAPTGQFNSPGFPGNYPDNAKCEYRITVESGKAIKINFNPFSLESDSGCSYDSVKIYEGSSPNGASAKANLCGDGPKSFTSKGNSVFIKLTSDGSVNKQGFSATYMTVNKTESSGGATVNDPSCGIPKVPQSRVIGGKDAVKGAWPWQIGMYQHGSFICGGTLIAPNWILTASHCVVSGSSVADASSFEIVVGDLHRSINDTTEQKHRVELVLAHPNYDRSTINNDIALMKLQTPVIMNEYVKTACIPEKNETIAVGSPCFITGWGKIKHPGGSHIMLQQAKLPVLNSSLCQSKIDKLGWGLTITRQMVCAGEIGSIKSGCHGDSGGPYVCPDNNGRFYLHGDVSWGSGRCDTSDAYTVFARVTEFVDWIKQSLKDN